jgi:hypothetical protein
VWQVHRSPTVGAAAAAACAGPAGAPPLVPRLAPRCHVLDQIVLCQALSGWLGRHGPHR